MVPPAAATMVCDYWIWSALLPLLSVNRKSRSLSCEISNLLLAPFTAGNLNARGGPYLEEIQGIHLQQTFTGLVSPFHLAAVDFYSDYEDVSSPPSLRLLADIFFFF